MISYIQGFFKQLFNLRCSKLAFVDVHSRISSRSRVFRFAKLIRSTVDAYSYIGPRTLLFNAKVGKFCSISWDCEIGLSNHPLNYLSTSPIFYEASNPFNVSWVRNCTDHSYDVLIGNDVWIGSGVKIMSGLTIGDGAIIGAGSIVTKNIPPFAIIAGVPGRVIRYRFDDEFIATLLLSPWWDCSENYLSKNAVKIGPDFDKAKYLENFKNK